MQIVLSKKKKKCQLFNFIKMNQMKDTKNYYIKYTRVHIHLACSMVNASILEPDIDRALFNSIVALCISLLSRRSIGWHTRVANHFIAIAAAKNFILLSFVFNVLFLVAVVVRIICFGTRFVRLYTFFFCCFRGRMVRNHSYHGYPVMY